MTFRKTVNGKIESELELECAGAYECLLAAYHTAKKMKDEIVLSTPNMVLLNHRRKTGRITTIQYNILVTGEKK